MQYPQTQSTGVMCPVQYPFWNHCVRKFKEEGSCEENRRELAESAAEEYVAVMESN